MQRSFTLAAFTATVSFTQAQQEAGQISEKAWYSYLNREYSDEVAKIASKKPSKDKSPKDKSPKGNKSPSKGEGPKDKSPKGNKSPKQPKSPSLGTMLA